MAEQLHTTVSYRSQEAQSADLLCQDVGFFLRVPARWHLRSPIEIHLQRCTAGLVVRGSLTLPIVHGMIRSPSMYKRSLNAHLHAHTHSASQAPVPSPQTLRGWTFETVPRLISCCSTLPCVGYSSGEGGSGLTVGTNGRLRTNGITVYFAALGNTVCQQT